MYKPISKTKLMDLLVKLNKIDQELCKFLKPDERYPGQAEGWFFLGYYNVLNAVYFEFCGVSEEDYYSQFKTGPIGSPPDLPVAWYEDKFDQVNVVSAKGPESYTCFIPDCINEVILDYKLTPKQKLKLLNRMFGDLAKLKKAHEKRKT
jgi:hypothetical protein